MESASNQYVTQHPENHLPILNPIRTTEEDVMNPNLTQDEESYLMKFLTGQSRGISSLRITANLLLLVGGLLLAGTAFYMTQNMTDLAAYTVGLPNFAGGILLVVCAIILSRRAANLKMLHTILSKLSRTAVAA